MVGESGEWRYLEWSPRSVKKCGRVQLAHGPSSRVGAPMHASGSSRPWKCKQTLSIFLITNADHAKGFISSTNSCA